MQKIKYCINKNQVQQQNSDEEPLKSQGLRIMPVKNYLVAYIPKEDEHTVYIIRIMYGGRDISKQLNDLG